MNDMTRELEWFLTMLQKVFHVVVDAEDVAVEATELGLEEVGEIFVPSEVISDLPETLLYEMMIVDDESGNEWVGAIGFHIDSPEWCILIVTKNEETVYRCTLPLRC